jgi:putative glutamine amidotransferase
MNGCGFEAHSIGHKGNSGEGRTLSDRDTTATAGRGPQGWIAVVGQWRKAQLRVPLPYVHAVTLAGGAPRVISTFELGPGEEPPADLDVIQNIDPHDASILEGAVGLLIPGGGDIDPELYGRKRHPRTHNVSQRRDRFELTLLTEAFERDMPVLAICHGMQLLNVHEGGTLNQHLLDDQQKLDHYRDRPLAEPAHGVSLKEGSFLADIMGSVSIQVNTHHHQGLDDVAPTLDPVGWSEDGVLEVVIHKQQTWTLGVQWHPEAMAPVDAAELAIFEAFNEATLAYERSKEGVTAQSA